MLTARLEREYNGTESGELDFGPVILLSGNERFRIYEMLDVGIKIPTRG